MKLRTLFILALVFCASALHSNAAVEKLKPAEIIAKHLEAVGTAEKRAQTKNQLVVGEAAFRILRAGSGTTSGRVVMASEANKFFIGAAFSSPEYPADRISFDGKEVNVANTAPGLRSPFGNFIFSNKQVFSEGLFGGVLSNSWSLYDLERRQAKVIGGGTKKVNGVETHVLEYLPKRGADAAIRLFFDSKTFHHIRTEYLLRFSAAQGRTIEQSSRESDGRHILTEEFSEFSNESGLVLPHKYRIHLSLESRTTTEFEWNFQLSGFLFNQKLDAKSFDVNAE